MDFIALPLRKLYLFMFHIVCLQLVLFHFESKNVHTDRVRVRIRPESESAVRARLPADRFVLSQPSGRCILKLKMLIRHFARSLYERTYVYCAEFLNFVEPAARILDEFLLVCLIALPELRVASFLTPSHSS